MRRTEAALAAWREAWRDAERARETLLEEPDSELAQAICRAADLREAEAEAEFRASVAQAETEHAVA